MKHLSGVFASVFAHAGHITREEAKEISGLADHTAWGAAIGAATGAAGGYLYDHYEKSKEAEYQKGYKAGLQSSQKSQ